MSEKDTIKCLEASQAQEHDMSHNAHDVPTKMSDVAIEAAKATSQEQSMTLMQGLRTYPKAVAWSVVISTAIVIEGFDKGLIASLFANPAFNQQYGDLQPNGSYELDASWQTALSIGSAAGEILGLCINGIVAEKFGYRWTISTYFGITFTHSRIVWPSLLHCFMVLECPGVIRETRAVAST